MPQVGTAGLIARGAFPVSERRFRLDTHAPTYSGRRYYIHGYLWESYEARDAVVFGGDGPDADYVAFWQGRPYRPHLGEGDPAERGIGIPTGPKLGDIHFVAGEWNTDAISHEAMHAALWTLRVLVASGGPSLVDLAVHTDDYDSYSTALGSDRRRDSFRHGCAEEEVCYAHGRLVRALYLFLHHADPS